MITENFSWDEANCKDGTQVPEGLKKNVIKVAENMEVLRKALGVPIHVNSWYRSKKYNSKLPGASKNSQHLQGKAMDIWITNLPPITIYIVIEALIRLGMMEQGGLGVYNTFVHYDVRGTVARWDLRT